MAEREQKSENYLHIVRIANVDLPGDKPLRWALTNIKGIGINLADALCSLAQIDRKTKTGNLKPAEIERLNQFISNPMKSGLPHWLFNRCKDYESGDDVHVITGNLSFVHDNDLKRLKKIKCLRGLRHMKGLPVRGQRTRSHFRKNKGKVVGVVKKKAEPGKAVKDDKGDKGGKDKKK